MQVAQINHTPNAELVVAARTRISFFSSINTDQDPDDPCATNICKVESHLAFTRSDLLIECIGTFPFVVGQVGGASIEAPLLLGSRHVDQRQEGVPQYTSINAESSPAYLYNLD